jgi:hypothetical protein
MTYLLWTFLFWLVSSKSLRSASSDSLRFRLRYQSSECIGVVLWTHQVKHPVRDRFSGLFPSGTSSTPAVGGILLNIDPDLPAG